MHERAACYKITLNETIYKLLHQHMSKNNGTKGQPRPRSALVAAPRVRTHPPIPSNAGGDKRNIHTQASTSPTAHCHALVKSNVPTSSLFAQEQQAAHRKPRCLLRRSQSQSRYSLGRDQADGAGCSGPHRITLGWKSKMGAWALKQRGDM